MSPPATRASRSDLGGIRRVWVTRARPGAQRTADRLTALGFIPVVAPLLEIRPLPVTPDLTGVQALAFTSANGVAAFAALSPARDLPILDLPVFAVGDATAAAAQALGFTRVRSADGDLTALANLIRAEGAGLSILHPRAAMPAGDLAAAVGDAARIASLVVYEARETEMTPPDVFDAVMIHSPRAARALADRPTPTEGRVVLAISPAAAGPLTGLGFAEVRVATAPDEDALLATLGKPGTNV
ncbi:MAG: uroporphyrinogen-III synthase [Alphaproteobacteria bacterium]|nr:uroporphyrinogen-III synthase [Alphaproteobacteria bacterium]MBU2379628.1 uroporphyrinogen-III synthase [Alphaproteobacteria bacterium]